jgi:prepilin-type N-terminal cleavage/methylation domain-containing protein
MNIPHTPNKHAKLRRGFTLIEILVVVGIIAVLASLAFPVAQSVMQRAYKVRAQAMVMGIKTSVGNYQTDYNKFPISGSAGETPILTDDTSDLISVLIGQNQSNLNPKEIRFLDAPMGKNDRGGLITTGSSWSLVDSWGKPYSVIMDANYDNVIDNPDISNEDQNISSGAPPQLPTQVAVYCNGQDGNEGTRDDIVSWR